MSIETRLFQVRLRDRWRWGGALIGFMFPLRRCVAGSAWVILAVLPRIVGADAGPPFLTNDPGTPGNERWEINIGSVATRAGNADIYQVPQIDLNYGLGDRVQLTYEIPYEIDRVDGRTTSGWGNAFPGLKWRFLDEGETGWQMAVFPQLETRVSRRAAQAALGETDTRLLLPVELARTFGRVAVDLEAGYYTLRGPRERILGGVAGSVLSPRFELDLELYDDRVFGSSSLTTLDIGGRYRLSPAFILLALAGHSVQVSGTATPEWFGYVGIQILLEHGGRSLARGE